MKRWRRTALLAGYLSAGAFLMQLGTMCNSTMTAGGASGGFLIDDNGAFLGLINVCGQENVIVIDEDGIPGEVQFAEDDLMFGCPARRIITPEGDG